LERCFHSGLVLGFNEVISILQQQHDALPIGRRELRLDETEPERDLRYAWPTARTSALYVAESGVRFLSIINTTCDESF